MSELWPIQCIGKMRDTMFSSSKYLSDYTFQTNYCASTQFGYNGGSSKMQLHKSPLVRINNIK